MSIQGTQSKFNRATHTLVLRGRHGANGAHAAAAAAREFELEVELAKAVCFPSVMDLLMSSSHAPVPLVQLGALGSSGDLAGKFIVKVEFYQNTASDQNVAFEKINLSKAL